jgi:hypothetical protein
MEAKIKRPAMITAIGALNMIVGALVMLIAFVAPKGAQGAFLLGLGLCTVAVGVGLIRLRPWGRWAAIGGYIVNIVVGIAQANPLAILIPSLLLAYLFSDGAKAAFALCRKEAPLGVAGIVEQGQ